MVLIEMYIDQYDRINFPIAIECTYPHDCAGKIANCTAAEHGRRN